MNYRKPITLTAITALKPGDILRDTTLKGFGARRNADTLTYFVQTRINRKLRWITIGPHQPWTPDTARKRAKDLLLSAAKNVDLKAEEAPKQTNLTIETLFDRFFEDRKPYFKPSTFKEFSRVANKVIIPHFKGRDVTDIPRLDVSGFHRSLKHTPGAANHALAVLKQAYNWASVNDLIADKRNPCLNIQMFKSASRAKFMTTDDVTRLADGCRRALTHGEATPFVVAAILFLLFTGARRNEVFTLKRCYVDKERMLAHLPDSKTGSKVLHLNAVAVSILNSIPEVEGNPYYFVGRDKGTHISEIYKPWDKIRKYAKLEHFRLHDLRHSFASFAADTGASAKTVGTLLGHASVETTQIYIHMFSDRAKQTAQSTAEHIFSAFNPAEPRQQPNPASDPSATHSNPQGHTEPAPFVPRRSG